MARDFEALHREIDDLIRRGRGDLAAARLDKLGDVKIPRPFAAKFAHLARRAGDPHFGIRVLNPIVRPDRKMPVEANAEEKAEYAHCLIRIGASEEATVLLDGIGETLPQVLLYRAAAHVSRWEYAEAIPLLEKYVKSSELDTYARIVGKVNLAAALVSAQTAQSGRKATYLLRELLHETSLRRYDLLHGNLLEIAAQHFALKRKWADVDQCLERARTALKNTPGAAAFFVSKWKAITQVRRSPGDETVLAELQAIRAESRNREHWETLRQCDEAEGLARHDAGLLTYLYFGTPFESFRRRMEDDFEGTAELPRSYVWRGSPAAQAGGPEVDLVSGEWVSPTRPPKGAKLKPGQLLHRLLATLASDFYRPQRLAAIHFQLYPGEYFNPASSPFRVYEAVKRLRAWLEETGLPLAVDESRGFYRLSFHGPCGLRLHRETRAADKSLALLLKLRAALPAPPFSVGEACQALGLPARSTQRFLEAAVKEGHLVRLGRSRATRYDFKAA